MYDCTEERFLNDVAQHEMKVVRDDGVSRHLRFQKPGTYNTHFDLITWPGYLCYTGDMGTYVFRRLEDMFEFFRADRMHLKPSKALRINPSYWGEKLEAIDKNGKFRTWSREKFEARLREDFKEWIDEYEPEKAEELMQRLEDEILDGLDNDDARSAYRAAMDFEVDDVQPFQDWWEVDTEVYTFHFIWCCYALAWGIKKYDESKAPQDAPHGAIEGEAIP